MKKLVILFVLAFVFNQTEIKAQSIVVPVGEDFTIIATNATDIVLENGTSGEKLAFNTAAEMYANWSSLSCGKYRAEFKMNGEKQRARINIELRTSFDCTYK
ncbi:MAG: hypothetical protein ACK5UE_13485 [Chitinophagales bacterium]|nr:hypothetical protein [Sphingobacteriales bacterium]